MFNRRISSTPSTGSKRKSYSLPTSPSLKSLHARIAKKLNLEEKTHHIVSESKIESRTNFSMLMPGIYEERKAKSKACVLAEDSEIRQQSNIFDQGQKTNETDKGGLMSLPVEVRKTIYSMVLVKDYIILICACSTCKSDKTHTMATQPSLTRTTHQIRAEALPIFYGENRFRIPGSHRVGDEAHPWIRGLSLQARSFVQHVELASFSLSSVVNLMSMYHFERNHDEVAGKVDWIGEREHNLLWLVFKGMPVFDDEVETGVASVARVVRPRLLLDGSVGSREKPLPAMPVLLEENEEGEGRVMGVEMLGQAVRVRLEKRSRANDAVFNRLL